MAENPLLFLGYDLHNFVVYISFPPGTWGLGKNLSSLTFTSLVFFLKIKTRSVSYRFKDWTTSDVSEQESHFEFC